MHVSPSSGAGCTVYILDTEPAVREALTSAIAREGWNAAAFACPAQFLAAPKADAPSCLVADLSLPGMGGLEVQSAVLRERPNLPIIFFSRDACIRQTVSAMKAGAFDFLMKTAGYDALTDAVRNALVWSGRALDRSIRKRVLRDAYQSLTKREKQVLTHVASGAPNKNIALELGISLITVKAHRGSVMRKMSAGSLAELVKMEAELRA